MNGLTRKRDKYTMEISTKFVVGSPDSPDDSNLTVRAQKTYVGVCLLHSLFWNTVSEENYVRFKNASAAAGTFR